MQLNTIGLVLGIVLGAVIGAVAGRYFIYFSLNKTNLIGDDEFGVDDNNRE